ncbi:hypothetical protein Tco_0649691 [Tanacetum coccineum]
MFGVSIFMDLFPSSKGKHIYSSIRRTYLPSGLKRKRSLPTDAVRARTQSNMGSQHANFDKDRRRSSKATTHELNDLLIKLIEIVNLTRRRQRTQRFQEIIVIESSNVGDQVLSFSTPIKDFLRKAQVLMHRLKDYYKRGITTTHLDIPDLQTFPKEQLKFRDRNQSKYSWTISPSLEALLTTIKTTSIKCFNVAKMHILSLTGKKCLFMVKEGIMLGHKVSEAGLKVDKAKIEVISKLPPPTNIKETSDDSEVDDNFLGETLMEINTEDEPWFADFANYLASDIIPKGITY